MKVTDVLGVKFVNAGLFEAVEQAMRVMEAHESAYVVAPNSELLQAARENRKLMAAVRGAELVLPEGNGIIYSSHVLGMPIEQRICALDFASALMARMSEKGMSVYILGNNTELVELAEEKITLRYPGIHMAGSDDGFYTSEADLFEAINEAEPDLLLVCFGSPRQELWMCRNRDKVKAGLMLGFGEGIELLAGTKKRAPKRWRDSGFEWLYWLIKEPRRIPRMIRRSGLVFTAMWRRLVG